MVALHSERARDFEALASTLSDQPGSAPTAAQLKAEIVRGRTGEPVSTGEPGAAPLGTCDEAGGASPKPRELVIAQLREAAAARRKRSAMSAPARRDPAVSIYGFIIAGIACSLGAALLML